MPLLEPTIIGNSDPFITFGLLLATFGMFYIVQRVYTIRLHLQWVLVQDGAREYFALIDKSDLMGIKLRLLYLVSKDIRGCEIRINGLPAYALMDVSVHPNSGYSYIANHPSFNLVEPLRRSPSLTYLDAFIFPGPNLKY